MGSYSDSTSDLDEELPVFDFLQPGRHLSQASQNIGGSNAEGAAALSSAKGNAGASTGRADVMMISSDSDDDAPHVPLAQRLKQKQDNLIRTSSTVTNGKDAEQCSPSNLAGSRLSCQNGFSEAERPLSLHQMRTLNSDGSEDSAAALPQRWLPPKHLSNTGSADTSPVKRKPAKRTARRRREARERQQGGKEVLRQEQERQKAEKKALAEAAKALRPEECIKHMVVAVDPGKAEMHLALCTSH